MSKEKKLLKVEYKKYNSGKIGSYYYLYHNVVTADIFFPHIDSKVKAKFNVIEVRNYEPDQTGTYCYYLIDNKFDKPIHTKKDYSNILKRYNVCLENDKLFYYWTIDSNEVSIPEYYASLLWHDRSEEQQFEEFRAASYAVINHYYEANKLTIEDYCSIVEIVSDMGKELLTYIKTGSFRINVINSLVDEIAQLHEGYTTKYVKFLLESFIDDLVKNKSAIVCENCGSLAKYWHNKRYCGELCSKSASNARHYLAHVDKIRVASRDRMRRKRKEDN